MVDIDGSVYVNNHLGFCIEKKKLSILACDEIVHGSGVKFPYVFVADDAFGFWTKATYDEAIPRAEIDSCSDYFQPQIIQGKKSYRKCVWYYGVKV